MHGRLFHKICRFLNLKFVCLFSFIYEGEEEGVEVEENKC